MEMVDDKKARIFDIKRDSSEDGPGIRTTVFFQGCPLSCSWCHNPEGKRASLGIWLRMEVCRNASCGQECLGVCTERALQPGRPPRIEYDLCNRCDNCFGVCPEGALEPVGRLIGFEELLYEVEIDMPFYHPTGGGVTLSGGEPTLQMEFVGSFLRLLKSKGINTAIETCGYFHYGRFCEELLPYLDLVLFDIKLIDDQESRRYAGKSNRRILENFQRLVSEGKGTVIPRVPLIPGITTTERNLTGIARFLRESGVDDCFLLPYNPLWLDKSKKLGRKSDYTRAISMTPAETNICVEFFRSQFP